MIDIVKVLRGEELFPCEANAVEEIRCGRGDCTCDMLKMEKAADEIERLRAALREISQKDMQLTVKKIGHLSAKYGPYAKIANAALEEVK
jgi:hypothetical protein